MNDDPRLMLCTCPDRDTGLSLAKTLVEERLAACVNLVPGITSVYRWEGALQEDAEVLLLIKSTTARTAALIERLGQLHPYEVPEIIALPITEGSTAYLSWLDNCTRERDQ
ncbi:divalent-cation tolerance protein CutA [Thiocystis violacea]|uniref:divalent-cation tolerance protein CutA n=1 Tax=Thiocystis violacea TaxID=13725 RepID=UPI001906297F|nr:divalent-cation tolerance protein CutA [Thiocystis violacea]MBK1723553.1 divalent-cation tolerance protein CutA [Thiocystis violacea]